MTKRIVAIATAHVAIAGSIIASGDPRGLGSVAAVAGFAAAFALVGFVPMHLEFGRHACTVTLVEAVLVAALFRLETTGVIVALTAGELLTVAAARQRPVKIAFNVSATFAAVTLAAHAFALTGTESASSPIAWAWALAAAAVYGFANHASTSAVLMLVERQRFDAVFLASATTAALATTAAASIGLAAVALAALSPWAPLLVMPLVALVVLETRRLAAHRAEHLRFERLYLASRDTARLQNAEDVLAALAGEARRLLTGSVGICCGPDRHGSWHGVVVDDVGHLPASADVVAAARAVAATSPQRGEVAGSRLPAALRRLTPAIASAVVARSEADSVVPVVLVVLREIGADGGQSSRADVLGAFAGHASLTLSNALLYAEVEDALRHQRDLNRQKDDFVAVVSHELRTPLTALLGSIRTLRRFDLRLAPERRERMYDIADHQGVRLQRLIEDLLLVAAAEDESACCTLEPVVLPDLLSELIATLEDAGQVVAVDVAPATRMVMSDQGKLAQLLFNLIENATKYAPGPIEVVAQMGRGGPTISIIDHGGGIAASDRDRAFERFVQLDQSSTREKGGTGLGLYLCRRLAHLLGGTLDLTDTPGGGCTFSLSLPMAAAGVRRTDQPDRAIAAHDDPHEDGHIEGKVLAG